MADEMNTGLPRPGGNGAGLEQEDAITWLLRQIDETFGTITEEEWAGMDIPEDVAVNYRRHRDAAPAKPLSQPR